ncbi:MAG: hypothetical protein ABFD49_07305 [Armatimonadota bacterium]|nr:glycoside hydrolase family 20 zincin-like fold domain-containing protein [bacterium]
MRRVFVILVVLLLMPLGSMGAISISVPLGSETFLPYTTQLLQERLSELANCKVVAGSNNSEDLIIDLRIEPELSSDMGVEGYDIKAGDRRVVIKSASGNGLLYGSCRLIEWIMSETTAGLLDRTNIDIDFPVKRGQASSFIKKLPEWSIREKPFYSERSAQLSNLSVGVADLVKTEKKVEKYNFYSEISEPYTGTVETWKNWCDWLARHRMNSISNWPYSCGTNWWELANDPATEGMSLYSKEEIAKAAKVREELLKYARSRGLRPYLMNYIPGAPTDTIKKKHPEMIGKKYNPDYPDPFDISSQATTDIFCKQIRAIARTYPSLAGIHMRWWGESFLDPKDSIGKLENLTLALMNSAKEERPDIEFLMSGYFRSGGTKKFADKMPQGVIIQTKWDNDWEPSPDPDVPFNRIAELKQPLLISQALPAEEFQSIGGVQYRSLAKGVMKYVDASDEVPNLSGFSFVVGEKDHEWITETNFIAATRLNWDPKNTDVEKLVKNYIAIHYGGNVVEPVYKALDLTQDANEKFVVDFAGVCPFIDCYRTHDMFGIQRASGLSVEQLQKGLAEITGEAETMAEALSILKDAEKNVKKHGRTSYKDLLVQTQWFADFFASRKLMTEAFICKKSADIDGMVEKLNTLRKMDADLLALAMSKPNISDYFEMEGMTKAVQMKNAFLRESRQIDSTLDPNAISLLKGEQKN